MKIYKCKNSPVKFVAQYIIYKACSCSVCGSEFCWLCMKEISDLHYLSPSGKRHEWSIHADCRTYSLFSGCTFWGKKPWSRKKKLLWQLGTLVGAPVGIALIGKLVFLTSTWIPVKSFSLLDFAAVSLHFFCFSGHLRSSLVDWSSCVGW